METSITYITAQGETGENQRKALCRFADSQGSQVILVGDSLQTDDLAWMAESIERDFRNPESKLMTGGAWIFVFAWEGLSESAKNVINSLIPGKKRPFDLHLVVGCKPQSIGEGGVLR